MSEETWLSFTKAVQMVHARTRASVGRSQAIVREAIASGEVRTAKSRTASLYLIGDDGLEGLINDREADEWATKLNVEDLIDRLDRTPPAAGSGRQKSPREQHDRKRAKKAAVAIWGEARAPEHLTNGQTCTAIIDELKRGGQKDLPSDSTMLRAVGRKK